MSEDGAKSFESIYPYYNYIHPDHHAFYIHPDDPSYIIDGNDGGLNISHDRGQTRRFVENLPVAQYYHISVDMDFPYNMYGGMQDNGSWQGPAYVWRNGGIRNSYFQEINFGDGFDVVVDSSNSRFAYAMSQRGNVGRVDLQTGHSNFVRPANPTGEELRFNWNVAIAVSPHDEETVYFGSQFVHKSTNRGDSWQIISPDLTTDDSEKQQQHNSGGLTINATGAENFTTITTIDPSSLDRNVIWVGTDDGNVQLTREGGQSWNNVVDNMDDVPEGSWVTQVHASKYDPAEAVVVINNYRRGDWSPYVMKTENYGRSWENIVADKGLYGYALSFVQDPVELNLMFTGTEMGLYVSIDGGESWTEWEPGYPTVSTYDMTIHPREHDLVIGTFVRSAWVLDDIRPLRELAANGADELEQAINLYPAPDAYLASIHEASGTRFAADAIFRGENRPFGARLTYSVVQPEDTESDEENGNGEEEKVTIEIYNQAGENIRTLEETPEHDGINRTTWSLEEKGVHEPSRSKPDADAPEPSGPEVLPGTYKVKMTYRGASDSTNVHVHFDPRTDVRMADLRARKQMMEELMVLQKSTAKTTNNLLDALDMIQSAEKMIKTEKGDDNEEQITQLKEETEAVKDSVDALLDYVFGPVDERQGITREAELTPSVHLERPEYYISSGLGGSGATEHELMDKAREAADDVVTKVNSFLETEWPEYVQTIESANLSPFKKIEPITL